MALHLSPAPNNVLAATPSAFVAAAGARVRSLAPPSPSRVRASSSSRRGGRRRLGVAVAMADGEKEQDPAAAKDGRMNLNEYMVAVDRPPGVRFALAVDGRVFVHSLKGGGNAEKSRIIMVGDTLKKAGNGQQDEGLVDIKDLGDTEYGTSNVSIVE